MKKELSFEEAMERLNEIVGLLESGEAPLDESLKLFEEGVKLTERCGAKLSAAEQKITKITSGKPKDETVPEDEA